MSGKRATACDTWRICCLRGPVLGAHLHRVLQGGYPVEAGKHFLQWQAPWREFEGLPDSLPSLLGVDQRCPQATTLVDLEEVGKLHPAERLSQM